MEILVHNGYAGRMMTPTMKIATEGAIGRDVSLFKSGGALSLWTEGEVVRGKADDSKILRTRRFGRGDSSGIGISPEGRQKQRHYRLWPEKRRYGVGQNESP